jgi:hypothetical protein
MIFIGYYVRVTIKVIETENVRFELKTMSANRQYIILFFNIVSQLEARRLPNLSSYFIINHYSILQIYQEQVIDCCEYK